MAINMEPTMTEISSAIFVAFVPYTLPKSVLFLSVLQTGTGMIDSLTNRHGVIFGHNMVFAPCYGPL